MHLLLQHLCLRYARAPAPRAASPDMPTQRARRRTRIMRASAPCGWAHHPSPPCWPHRQLAAAHAHEGPPRGGGGRSSTRPGARSTSSGEQSTAARRSLSSSSLSSSVKAPSKAAAAQTDSGAALEELLAQVQHEQQQQQQQQHASPQHHEAALAQLSKLHALWQQHANAAARRRPAHPATPPATTPRQPRHVLARQVAGAGRWLAAAALGHHASGAPGAAAASLTLEQHVQAVHCMAGLGAYEATLLSSLDRRLAELAHAPLFTSAPGASAAAKQPHAGQVQRSAAGPKGPTGRVLEEEQVQEGAQQRDGAVAEEPLGLRPLSQLLAAWARLGWRPPPPVLCAVLRSTAGRLAEAEDSARQLLAPSPTHSGPAPAPPPPPPVPQQRQEQPERSASARARQQDGRLTPAPAALAAAEGGGGAAAAATKRLEAPARAVVALAAALQALASAPPPPSPEAGSGGGIDSLAARPPAAHGVASTPAHAAQGSPRCTAPSAPPPLPTNAAVLLLLQRGPATGATTSAPPAWQPQRAPAPPPVCDPLMAALLAAPSGASGAGRSAPAQPPSAALTASTTAAGPAAQPRRAAAGRGGEPGGGGAARAALGVVDPAVELRRCAQRLLSCSRLHLAALNAAQLAALLQAGCALELAFVTAGRSGGEQEQEEGQLRLLLAWCGDVCAALAARLSPALCSAPPERGPAQRGSGSGPARAPGATQQQQRQRQAPATGQEQQVAALEALAQAAQAVAWLGVRLARRRGVNWLQGGGAVRGVLLGRGPRSAGAAGGVHALVHVVRCWGSVWPGQRLRRRMMSMVCVVWVATRVQAWAVLRDPASVRLCGAGVLAPLLWSTLMLSGEQQRAPSVDAGQRQGEESATAASALVGGGKPDMPGAAPDPAGGSTPGPGWEQGVLERLQGHLPVLPLPALAQAVHSAALLRVRPWRAWRDLMLRQVRRGTPRSPCSARRVAHPAAGALLCPLPHRWRGTARTCLHPPPRRRPSQGQRAARPTRRASGAGARLTWTPCCSWFGPWPRCWARASSCAWWGGPPRRRSWPCWGAPCRTWRPGSWTRPSAACWRCTRAG